MGKAHQPTADSRKRWWLWHVLGTRPALATGGFLLIVIAAAATFFGMHPAPALLLGFDIGALVFFATEVRQFHHAETDDMRRRARSQDAGRWGILWSGIALSVVVLVALGTELKMGRAGSWASLAIAAASIILSWLFMNTLFALHYAHGFYGGYGEAHKGLDFPGDEDPDYWDFAYFALVIGMTFQVSDVEVTSRYLRRMVLLHGVIAFFFNVFIIAVSVNIVAGQA